jgi:hypothetical protein
MTACTQPGCTGTIVDGYCDVCGSPVGAVPLVPTEAAGPAGSPTRADEPGLTAVGPGSGFPPKPKKSGLETACTQPGCIGTIVDCYCDVCGSPAGAAPLVLAKTAASALDDEIPIQRIRRPTQQLSTQEMSGPAADDTEKGEGEEELAGDEPDDAQDYRTRVEKAQLPDDVREAALCEVGKLERTSDQSPESGDIRIWLDTILDLSWSTETTDSIDIQGSREVEATLRRLIEPPVADIEEGDTPKVDPAAVDTEEADTTPAGPDDDDTVEMAPVVEQQEMDPAVADAEQVEAVEVDPAVADAEQVEAGQVDPAAASDCMRPGCTGTIVDGYCDVCGSPADAAPFVPAGTAASAASRGPAAAGQVEAVEVDPAVADAEQVEAVEVDPAVADAEQVEAGQVDAAAASDCMRPGCTGTIVDGYCDVCGSPAGAAPFVPAGGAAYAASPGLAAAPDLTAVSAPAPRPAAGPGPTAVRRGVLVAGVLFLLGCAVVLYQLAPGFLTFGSRPSPTASSAPTTVGTATDPRNGSAAAEAIQFEDLPKSAKPFETVRIKGTYGGGEETFLRVERWEDGKWLAFPVPTKTDQSGRFTAYVEFGKPGRYQLRVVHLGSGMTSKPFVLVIKA